MRPIKRCWGCGKWILPWQKTTHTKLAGTIHKGCAFMAEIHYKEAELYGALLDSYEEQAVKRLNEEERK